MEIRINAIRLRNSHSRTDWAYSEFLETLKIRWIKKYLRDLQKAIAFSPGSIPECTHQNDGCEC
jgi:hypothetical protein